jgi:UbiD family decarboxylase
VALLSFRDTITHLERNGRLVKLARTLSKKLEAAQVLKSLEPRPARFKVTESPVDVAGNICTSKHTISEFFELAPSELTRRILAAIRKPTKARETDDAACLEAREKEVDLNSLPLLLHYSQDGGNYVTSAVVIGSHKDVGQNVSFHRLMQLSKDTFAIRIVPRHLHALLERYGGTMPVAICIGNSPSVLLAAACSVNLGQNELEIANSLAPLEVVWCEEAECFVPADSEFVLIGRILPETADEGPFLDLTETYDIVRKQPVVKIERIYHRTEPIYHALLPGGLEHKALMGLPKEATIFEEVDKICDCVDVSVTPGGCSWLHAVVQIRKHDEEDGLKAIEAAFRGHASLKHVFVVDEDINIADPAEVEWATATRFQADRGLIVKTKQVGSSLDPSADPTTRETSKVGFDATKPLVAEGKNFEKVVFPKVDLSQYV